MKNHSTIFNKELQEITDVGIRAITEETLNCAPNYFWSCLASGTGKYHKLDECVEGGTVLHVKRAVRVCLDLARFEQLDGLETDIAVAAVILHDVCKCGYPTSLGRTVMGHGALVAQVMRDAGVINRPYARQIANLCATHMSQWDCPFLKPVTPLDLVVSLSDYVASRKSIMVKTIGEGEY